MLYLIVENRLQIAYYLYYSGFILLRTNFLVIGNYIMKKISKHHTKDQKNIVNKYVDI